MERQSEQELLAIAPVETESLEGNRIYQVTGRELTQIAEISAREASDCRRPAEPGFQENPGG